MEIKLKPIGFVKNSRNQPIDDNWEEIISEIELADNISVESLKNISDFSHLEVIYFFNKVNRNEIIFCGHPRGNPEYPSIGFFAQRKKDRPNTIGTCIVKLLEHNERTIKVAYLDAINGTPVLDIKPEFKEFQVKGEIIQPQWVSDLMKNYW